MYITLNIGLNASKHYLPEGVEDMHLQAEYVTDYLGKVIGTPLQIGVAKSTTEKTIVVSYSNVEAVLKKLFWIAAALKQDCIAYSIQDGGATIGGALVGEYAHEWNYGIFNEAYFVQAM